MYLKSVGIYNSRMAAYRSKVKTIFAFLNEIFHQASLAVKFEEMETNLRVELKQNKD